jgi:hypothetical protein
MNKESEKQFSGEWKITVARNFEEIEALRPIWELMQRKEPCPKPNADISRYLSVVGACDDSLQPHVIFFEHNGSPVAMIIGWVGKHQLELRLGYKTLLKPSLKCLSVVYGGILGQPDGELCSLLVDELMKQLRNRQFDIVQLSYLGTDTDFYQAARKIPGFFTRCYSPKIDEHWSMSVPETIEHFYASRSGRHRRNLQRYVRKFEDEYPGENKYVRYTSESDVAEFIKIAADISSRNYQGALGVGVVDNEETRHIMTVVAKNGWFDGIVLMAGDRPCAFQSGLRYGRVYYSVSIGYDPAFKSYRVGTILFLKVLESLCNDHSVDTIDFYFGDAEYKKHYGTEHWPEASVYIFAPKLRPIFINMLQGFTMRVNGGLEHIVGKIGAVDWIKRKWRNLLQAKNPDREFRVES